LSFEFFTDRDCGARILPGLLREHGITVHRHVDHFEHGVDDEVWLPAVAARGWVALTIDRRIRSNDLQRDAVFRSNARLIILTGGQAPTEQLARNFINTLDRIEAFLRINPPPFIARVRRPSPVSDIDRGKPGEIEMRLSLDQWKEQYGRG
jgi:hypothetical protein